MAIIIKMIGDKPVYNKIDLSPEERRKALKLHESLKILIPEIEKEFGKKVCEKTKTKKRKSRINNKLIYKLGERIKQVICDEHSTPDGEIDWVFKAIRDIYSKSDVFLEEANEETTLDIYSKQQNYLMSFSIKLLGMVGED